MENTEPLSDADISQIQLTDTIINIAANLGTDRDKRSYSRWMGGRGTYNGLSNRSGFNGSLSQNRVQLEEMYAEDWVCGKLIDIPVDDMMREWRTVDFDGNDDMKEAFEKSEERFGVRECLTDALKWSDLYGGAGIVLGIDNCGHSLLPLNPDFVQKGSLKFIRTLDRWYLMPQDINYYDISQHNYFKPNFYRIAGTAQMIHHSRMIRFDGIRMPRAVAQLNWLWGISKLQRIQDALLNAAATPNIIASQMYECNFPVINVEGLASTLSSAGGEQKLQARMAFVNLMKSMYNTTILDNKESYDLKSPSLSGLDIFIDKFLGIACAAGDICLTRFMGISPGGLNATGDSDLINYYDSRKSDQEKRLRPALNVLDSIILRSTFGCIPKEFSWKFNPLWQLSGKDKAAIDLSNAQRDAIYLQNNVLPPQVIARALQKNDTYSGITDDLVEEVGTSFVEQNQPQQTNLLNTNVIPPELQGDNSGFGSTPSAN